MKLFSLAALVPLMLLVGCASYEDYYYLPHPGMAEIPATQPSQPPVVTAFATVVGISTPDDRSKALPMIGTRLRLHNNGTLPITFDPHSISLSTSDLVQFPAPMLSVPSPVTIASGDTATFSADFPFPDGKSPDQLDLSSLQLRWAVQTGTGNAEQTLSFQRHLSRSYYYGNPYWDEYPAPYYGYAYPVPVFGPPIFFHHRW
jgi:hypothetical protein